MSSSRSLWIVRQYYPQVNEVFDAKQPAWVVVHDDDVTGATRKDYKNCPMARACKRSFDIDGVLISRATAYLIRKDKAERFRFRNDAQKNLISFDRRGKFTPGAYVLHSPDKHTRLGSGRNADSRYVSKRGGPRKRMHFREGVRKVLHWRG